MKIKYVFEFRTQGARAMPFKRALTAFALTYSVAARQARLLPCYAVEIEIDTAHEEALMHLVHRYCGDRAKYDHSLRYVQAFVPVAEWPGFEHLRDVPRAVSVKK